MTRRPLHRPTQERVAAHLAGVTKTTFMQVAKVALGFETDRSPHKFYNEVNEGCDAEWGAARIIETPG